VDLPHGSSGAIQALTRKLNRRCALRERRRAQGGFLLLLSALSVSTADGESQHPFEAIQKARRCASISGETLRFRGGQLNERGKFVTERLAPRSKRKSKLDRVGRDCVVSTNLQRGSRTSITTREPPSATARAGGIFPSSSCAARPDSALTVSRLLHHLFSVPIREIP